jgi:Tfp pilus assembly protein PilO
MNKTRQWATLTAVACLAILAAGWFLVVKPQRSHAAQLRTQTQSVQSANSQLTSQVDQLRQQQKDLPAQQKVLSQIATKIPDNPALPTLIRQLSAAADGAGVNLVSMAPSAPTVVGSAGAPAARAGGAAVAGSPLASIGLTLQVQGSYFNIEQFFSSVESLSRAMLVTNFTLSPGAGATTSSGGAATTSGAKTPVDTLTAQITASVFESPQVAPLTAQPAATTTVH